MAALSIDSIIQRIADLQDETGLFASFRHNPAVFYRRPDTNVFFTAVTVFTLQKLRSSALPETRLLIDHIASRATAAYPIFQNKDGLNTYNFWPTRPSQHFSNGYVFRHFEHFRIPDDIDDTAMVYLTTTPTPDEQGWLKNKLAQHANGSQPQRIKNTYPDYRDLRAYSTWFGKNMGVDFDACALSNTLYCIYQFDLPRNSHDTDSLTYLRSVVESGRYVSEPFRCAPHYARTSLIIYHLARLMSAFTITELEPIRPRLIADARQQLVNATNRVEKLILATSLGRLDESVPPINLDGIEQDFDTFHFFIAGLLTAYEQPLLRRFADRPLMQMRWQCEAHCWALVAEYVGLCYKG
ncbi:hypothetical protein [Spirosoma pollinicola]|uniref:Uncharacterized protein n=1 Tax=Spirosoma pollinicola TaxID=2057025 RepID=A0A2K8ZC98_9BACT|nr:hypothetical protein [Spirosoma pollinicola]AUD07503.1 hypothetical protein CWM47_27005 [Spirosoma pollinicola]